MKKTINTLIAAACLLPAMAMAATVTLNPVADAYVQGGNKAAVNYGTTIDLRAQTSGTANSNYKSYLRFDTGTGQVTGAKLRLYAALSRSGSLATSVRAVSDTNWSETAITWNYRQDLGSIVGRVTVANTAYAWQEIDVTGYVQSERAAGRSVISLGLNSDTISNVYLSADSREGPNPPQLVLVTNDAPTASLTSPTTGSTYTAPASVALSATAADADGSIASVDFYNGATLIGAGTLTGGSYTFDWTNVGAGSYSITAKATDNQGAVTASTPVSISVNGAPTVSLTSPANNSAFTAPATITLAATAADSNGISKVEFYNGTTLLGTDTTSPYSITLSGVAAGTYAYKAKAYDSLNASTLSATVNATVTVPPTVTLTAPATGSTYTAPASITLTAAAADGDGSIAAVEFYNGVTLIGAGTLAGGSYTLDWTNVGAGSYSITAMATDNQGAVTSSAPVSISVNGAPSISLAGPVDGSSYFVPASIVLSADAVDSDGSIASVEFYDAATLIGAGTLTGGSYAFNWTNVGLGSYSITAKATDNQGAVTTSRPVTVTVRVPTAASDIYYIHADHLNTPRVITDASNKIVWRWDSDPFGTEKANEDPDGDGTKFSYNLRFPGQYYDRETNLHYNYFRDYDPTTGRYVQSDPIGLEGGVNTYAYVDENPISYTDPHGLLNPAKAAVAVTNGINSARLTATAAATIAAATIAATTGAGAPVSAAALAKAAWNLKSAQAAASRAKQQWKESLKECMSDASWRNAWGLAPYGTNFDDPWEQTPTEFFRNLPSEGWGKAVSEFGMF